MYVHIYIYIYIYTVWLALAHGESGRDTDSEASTLACNISIVGTDSGDSQTRYENQPTCLSTFGSSEAAGEKISCSLLAPPWARSAIFGLWYQLFMVAAFGVTTKRLLAEIQRLYARGLHSLP